MHHSVIDSAPSKRPLALPPDSSTARSICTSNSGPRISPTMAGATGMPAIAISTPSMPST